MNLSLGGFFGSADGPMQDAVANVSSDGVIVVAASGNAGPTPYITGDPASADAALSVAALNPLYFSDIAFSNGASVRAQELTNVTTARLGSLPIVVLPDGSGGVGTGCRPRDYPPSVAGAIVVASEGGCYDNDIGIEAQKAHAAAAIIVSTGSGYPFDEAEILSDPTTGKPYHVTIPVLGVLATDGATLLAAQAADATADQYVESTTDSAATFSSAGPRRDNVLKPEVAAPGVNVSSAAVGTGFLPLVLEGTSMATPLVAGVAALVRQAHPTWKGGTSYWRAAVVNTATADGIDGYETSRVGGGLVQAGPAVATDAVAIGDRGAATLSYGYADFTGDYHATRNVTLHNFAASAVSFAIASANANGSPHSIVVPPTVTVAAHGTAVVPVELDVPAATAGDTSTLNQIGGVVTFSPLPGANHGVALAVPYLMLPRGASNLKTTVDMTALESTGSAHVRTTNANASVGGTADWYAWGISAPRSRSVPAEVDVRAAGAQEVPNEVSFALSTYGRWTDAAFDGFSIYVDVNHDGVDDYVVQAEDSGVVAGTGQNGIETAVVFSLATGGGVYADSVDAQYNSDTLVIRVGRDALCLDGTPCLASGNGRITYHVTSVVSGGEEFAMPGSATFNTLHPAISSAFFYAVAPGAVVRGPVTYRAAEAAKSPPLGFMIVTPDNVSTAGRQAQLIPLP